MNETRTSALVACIGIAITNAETMARSLLKTNIPAARIADTLDAGAVKLRLLADEARRSERNERLESED